MELDTSKITNMSAVEFTPLPSKLWGQGGTGAVPRGASWAMCGSSILLSSHALSAHIYTHGGEQAMDMEREIRLSWAHHGEEDAYCWAGSSLVLPRAADTSQPIAVLSLQLVSSTGAVRCV